MRACLPAINKITDLFCFGHLSQHEWWLKGCPTLRVIYLQRLFQTLTSNLNSPCLLPLDIHLFYESCCPTVLLPPVTTWCFYYYSSQAASVENSLTIQLVESLLLLRPLIKSSQPLAQGQTRASQRGARSKLFRDQSIS